MRALYACFGQLGVLSMQKLKAFFVYLVGQFFVSAVRG